MRQHPFTRRPLEKAWDSEIILSGLDIKYSIEGPSQKVTGLASLDRASKGDLAFCSLEGRKGADYVSKSKAGIIFCHKSLKGLISQSDCQVVFMDNPRLAFVRFANMVRLPSSHSSQIQSPSGPRSHLGTKIAPSAVIDESAEVGANCTIGDFVKIGKNCVIEDNVILDDRVTLVQNCYVGEGSTIQPGTVIGADGFAYERHEDGDLEKFPHFAGVIIERKVEISANCSIARGSLCDTVIGEGTKIDALVHIAHNVEIGRHCQLAAGTVIGGSTKLGSFCWTGLNSTIKNKINVGNNVLVGAGACVISNVESGDIVAGIPAVSIKKKVKTGELFLMVGRDDRISGGAVERKVEK